MVVVEAGLGGGGGVLRWWLWWCVRCVRVRACVCVRACVRAVRWWGGARSRSLEASQEKRDFHGRPGGTLSAKPRRQVNVILLKHVGVEVLLLQVLV